MPVVPSVGAGRATNGSLVCPLGCGPLDPGHILRDNRLAIPASFRIGWCPTCALGETRDGADVEARARLDAEHYAIEEDDAIRRVPRKGRGARLWHRLDGSLPLADRSLPPPVLDVGCHTGEAVRAAA